jgi:pimeloyl-ACP methyl ester carboxylesterase
MVPPAQPRINRMHVFNSDGLSIAYIDHAPTGPDIGEPILLIHGFGSNHAVNWVNTLWVKFLAHSGRRVIALDNRGHGASEKVYDPAMYHTATMAEDARRLIEHLKLGRVDVMGYSMGARITAFLALNHREYVRSAILGGLGNHLVHGLGLPMGIADAMEAPSLDGLTDPMQRMFRAFAEQTKSDLKALAACIRGSRQTLTREEAAAIRVPVLVAVGTKDDVAGNPHEAAALIPGAKALDIPGRDHNLAVGDKVYKEGVLAFIKERP